MYSLLMLYICEGFINFS